MRKLRLLFSICLVLGLLFGSFGIVSADDEPPEVETQEVEGINPVVEYLAELMELDPEDVIKLHETYGLGEIAKAYFLFNHESNEAISYDELLATAKEMGWGNYYKSLDLHPGLQGGIGWLFKYANQDTSEESESPRIGKPDKPGKPEHVGPPEHAMKNKEKSNGKGNKK